MCSEPAHFKLQVPLSSSAGAGNGKSAGFGFIVLFLHLPRAHGKSQAEAEGMFWDTQAQEKDRRWVLMQGSGRGAFKETDEQAGA